MNWIESIRGEDKPSCCFDYAVQLNEAMSMGILAMRAGQPIVHYGKS